MGRNKLVYALSETTVVIATDIESGGTWAGATEAMNKKICDVAVWMGDGVGPGNARLVELGARAVTSTSDIFEAQPMNEPGQRTADPRLTGIAANGQ